MENSSHANNNYIDVSAKADITQITENQEEFVEINSLCINPELQNLIPAQSLETIFQLKESMKSEGIRDAIIVRANDNTIVDGHTRIKLASELGINKVKIKKIKLDSQEDTIEWMINNQFAKRNLNDYQRGILANRLREVITAKSKARQGTRTDLNLPQKNGEGDKTKESSEGKKHENETDSKVAKIAGISRETMRKITKIFENATPEIKAKVEKGEISINKAFNKVKNIEKKAHKPEKDSKINFKYYPKMKVGEIKFSDQQYDILITEPPQIRENIDEFVRTRLSKSLEHIKNDGFAYIIIDTSPETLRAYLNIEQSSALKLSQILVLNIKEDSISQSTTSYIQKQKFCLFYKGSESPSLNKLINTKEPQATFAIDNTVEAAKRFIKQATKEGQEIFDPFAGEGKFLIAAAELGRMAYGIEEDENKAKIAFENGCQKVE